MAKSKYNESQVIKDLQKKGVTIDVKNKMIDLSRSSIGIKSLGKVDYLTNYCDYVRFYRSDI